MYEELQYKDSEILRFRISILGLYILTLKAFISFNDLPKMI